MTFKIIPFRICNLGDSFFDSLKDDYKDFDEWFEKRSKSDSKAYVDYDEKGQIHSFLSIKSELENEEIGDNPVLPAENRLKISTLKIDESYEGQRLGEGAIGIALWRWKQSGANQIYVTVFDKHTRLIEFLETFGFKKVSVKKNGEGVYLKDRRELDYSTTKKSFPFISPGYKKAKYLPIRDIYHDRMFQFSELKGIHQIESSMPVSNGITKIYIAEPFDADAFDYEEKDLIFVYRMHSGENKIFNSAVTSYCTVSKVIKVKIGNKAILSPDDYKKAVGNKSVYSDEEISTIYMRSKNVFVLELIYNGYFGEGNNVSMSVLKNSGLWEGRHPYESHISDEGVKAIFKLGGTDVQDVIID